MRTFYSFLENAPKFDMTSPAEYSQLMQLVANKLVQKIQQTGVKSNKNEDITNVNFWTRELPSMTLQGKK